MAEDHKATDCDCVICNLSVAVAKVVCDHVPPGAEVGDALIALTRVQAGLLITGTPRQQLNAVNLIKGELDRCFALNQDRPESAPASENTQVH